MARINIEDSLFRDGRWMDLLIKTGCKHKALGMVAGAWMIAQQTWLEHGCIPVKDWDVSLDPLIDVGLAERRSDKSVYVRGSEEAFAWLSQKSVNGQRISEKKLSQLANARSKRWANTSEDSLNGSERNLNGSEALTLSPTPPLSPSLVPTPKVLPSTETWKAYRAAYLERYRVEPLRDAKTNAQLKRFVERVGQENAPAIASFFVKHNLARYQQNAHSVDDLLYHASKLHTEFSRGKQITTTETRHVENKQQIVNAFSKHLEVGNE